MNIELGGGTTPHPDSDIVIDPVYPKGVLGYQAQVTPWFTGGRWDETTQGWYDYDVIPDGSADTVAAHHVLEHIPPGRERIAVFNEAHRVLKSGGKFIVRFPLVGYSAYGEHLVGSAGAWADPTHVSYWWLPESLWYFTGQGIGEDYGISRWAPLGEYVECGPVWVTPHLPSWWTVRWGWEGYACLLRP